MTDAVARLQTALVGRYAIERELGAGGMATVYLAQDVKHDRRVALKVLRPELSAILGGERFLAEIKTTANLQHPHILALHDSGEADGLVYYVMPYIEGESLRDRLVREKQLPVDDAVRITREVADALAYAHEHGIVHRDIKPENILLHGGHALVADFGIALAASRSDGGTRMTETGMSLGTPHYMSPEQAMGEREITAKSDVYALGCVLYEMLTGEPPFTGPTAQAIIARVMTEEPRSLTIQRRTVPKHVEAAVHTALAKLPADRFATAAQFAEALANAEFAVPATRAHAAGERVSSRWSRGTLALAASGAAVVVVAAALAAGRMTAPEPEQRLVQFVVPTVDSATSFGRCCGTAVALSPDGSRLVFVGSRSGTSRLYTRVLGRLDAEEIPGTEDAIGPFFSPDGRSVGFLAGTRLRKVSLAGGPALSIADVTGGVGVRNASWGDDDMIVYARDEDDRLYRVAASGGTPEKVSDGPPSDLHRHPWVLPGSRKVLFSIDPPGGMEDSRIALLDLASRRVDTLASGTRAAYANGRLVYTGADGSLLVQPFDASRGRATGPAVAMLEGVTLRAGDGNAEFTVSATGDLAYLAGAGGASEALALVGSGTRTPVELPRQVDLEDPAISPDGRRIALRLPGEGSNTDVWVFDRDLGTLTRLTVVGQNFAPVWSPDGRRIAFASTRDSASDAIYAQPADGSGAAELVFTASHDVWPLAWLRDGRVVIAGFRPGTRLDIGVLTPGDTAARWIVASPFQERHPAVSSDARWLAYASNRSGQDEVYVQALSGEGAVHQVSVGGGHSPRWSPDGRTLYYGTEARIMAARLTMTPAFSVSARTPHLEGTVDFNATNTNYDVHPRTGELLVVLQGGGGRRGSLVWIQNWPEILREMGTRR